MTNKEKVIEKLKKDIIEAQEGIYACTILSEFLKDGKIPNQGPKTLEKIKEKTGLYLYFCSYGYGPFNTEEIKFKRKESKENNICAIVFASGGERKTNEEMRKELEKEIKNYQYTMEKKNNAINNYDYILKRLGEIEEIQEELGELAYSSDIKEILYNSGIYLQNYR